MKKFTFLSLLLLAVIPPLSAQDNRQRQDQPSEQGGPSRKKHGKKHGPFVGTNLTLEERQRLAAARQKANDDPTVRSLREAKEQLGEQLDNAMRAAMLSADPTLGPALDKIKQARDRAKEMRAKFRSLTPEQKQQLKAARLNAKDDLAVQAAREKLRSAQGPETKRTAARELHEAMKAAMLKADPSLTPLLEQLGPPGLGGPLGAGPDGPPPPDTDEPAGDSGLE